MTQKKRAEHIVISVNIDEALLKDIDRRADALGVSRSQYIAMLARQDIHIKGDLILRETPPPYGDKKKPGEQK